MRLLLAAIAAVAALGVWLSRRAGDESDPLDTVQPQDPWPPRATGGPVGPGRPFIVGESGPEWTTSDNLAPAWSPDMPYLEALPLAHMRRIYTDPIPGT